MVYDLLKPKSTAATQPQIYDLSIR